MTYKRWKPGTFFQTPNKKILAGKPPELQVLFHWISDFADRETGYCFPSVETLAERCGVGVTTVHKYLIELEKLGILEREARFKKGTKERDTNAYYIIEIDLGTSPAELGGSPAEGRGGSPAEEKLTSVYNSLNNNDSSLNGSEVERSVSSDGYRRVSLSESENEISPRKKSAKPAREVERRIFKLFSDLASQHLGQRPIGPSNKDLDLIAKTLKETDFTEKILSDVFEEWFTARVTYQRPYLILNAALSPANLNGYRSLYPF